MEKTFLKSSLLNEVAQLKIFGGTSSSPDSNLTIYLGKGCKTWGEYSTYLSVTYKFNNVKDATPRHQKMTRSIEQRM